jgi:hypothetical protein
MPFLSSVLDLQLGVSLEFESMTDPRMQGAFLEMLVVESPDLMSLSLVEDPALAAREGRACRKWRLQFVRLRGAEIKLLDVNIVPRIQSIAQHVVADGSSARQTVIKFEVGEVRVVAEEASQVLLDELRVVGSAA